MKHRKKNASLFRRMLRVLLPGSAFPLVIFGYFAIASHFDSLKESHIQSTERLMAFMASEFADMTVEVDKMMRNTSRDDALKGDNDFAIRESIRGWRSANSSIDVFYLLDLDHRVVMADPPRPGQVGKELEADWREFTDNTMISRIQTNPRQTTSYMFLKSPVKNFLGVPKNYLVARVDLSPWFRRASEIVGRSDGVIAAVIPYEVTEKPIRIGKEFDQWWDRLAKLRAVGEVSGPITLIGEDYYGLQMELPSLDSRIVVAEPLANIYAAPRRVLIGSVALIIAMFILLAGLIYLLVRSSVRPIIEVASAAEQFSEGDMDVRVPVRLNDEVGVLAHSFNDMADRIKQSQFRTRALYQAIRELFNCDDLDSIVRKAVQLVCTEGHGTVAWFVPDRSVLRGQDGRKHGIGIWLWKDRHVEEVDIRQANGAWTSRQGDKIFAFRMRDKNRELGVLKVAYITQPSNLVESLLHSLINVVETAIEKQELIRNNALVSTELEIAETVQRNMLADHKLVSKQAEVAFHYQPASRLGGDWFYVIEDTKRDSIWVIMGDVTGHGLPQGLVTTAVKGALDVIELLIKKDDQLIQGPGGVLTMLDQVVARALGESKLAMTCVAIKIDFKQSMMWVCNAGHTFPIHIHHRDGVSWARHLQKEQQPVLGTAEDPDYVYQDSKYELQPGDLLVVYTDGLAEAKSLDSKVFGRFLFRNLRQRRDFKGAQELKKEILEMFQYYTQGAVIQDDVCFLILQMKPRSISSENKNVS